MYVNGIPRKLSEEFELKNEMTLDCIWATTDLQLSL